jgi:hypothetical protein
MLIIYPTGREQGVEFPKIEDKNEEELVVV